MENCRFYPPALLVISEEDIVKREPDNNLAPRNRSPSTGTQNHTERGKNVGRILIWKR
jgi:hypothetical protein